MQILKQTNLEALKLAKKIGPRKSFTDIGEEKS